jgi:hypothetical protein
LPYYVVAFRAAHEGGGSCASGRGSFDPSGEPDPSRSGPLLV